MTSAARSNLPLGQPEDEAWVSGAGSVISLLKKIAGAGAASAVTVKDSNDDELLVNADGSINVAVTGAALTALQLIDDIVKQDDTAFSPGTDKVAMIGAQLDNTGTDSVDEGDAGALRMSPNRNLFIQIRDSSAERSALVTSSGALMTDPGEAINGPGTPNIDSYSGIAINLAAGSNQSLVAAPGANKQIWIYGVQFSVNAAGTVSFQDEDDTAITGVMPFAANGGMAVNPSGNFAMPWRKLATNKALEVDVVTSELDGSLQYAIISV